jgi:hypothetical protein
MRTRQERSLVAAMDNLNGELSKVIRRNLKAELDRASWPLSTEEEAVLALQIIQVAQQLLLHSRREQLSTNSAASDEAAKPSPSNGRPS